MRLRRLDLLKYGAFTDQTLTFNGDRFGLHIVYGPNEAGKSTTLRAIRHLLFGIPGPVVIFTETSAKGRTQELERAGADVVRLAQVTPESVLAELGARGIQAVLVEGGAKVHGAFFDAGLADRIEVVVAPVVVGGVDAPGPIGGRGVEALAEGWRLERVGLTRRGGDGIFGGFRPGCLRGLSLHAEG